MFKRHANDIDAVIMASSAMKNAINYIGDKHDLPNGWLNMDFKTTKSYSDRLSQISVYYKTFSNILTVRTVAAEYLIAMKLMSGRQYKNDLSDIAGILWEHQKNGNPIAREAIDNAIAVLYGDSVSIPEVSQRLIDEAFTNCDYETLFMRSRESGKQSKEVLLDFENDYPNALKEDNIDNILEMAKQKREQDKLALNSKFNKYKQIAKGNERPATIKNKSRDAR